MSAKSFAFVLTVMMLALSAVSAQSPQSAAPLNSPAPPQTLKLPAGTLIAVRTTQFLSSDRNRPGDGFAAILDQPMVVQGWVVARRGQNAMGNVTFAQRASRNQDNSQLVVELNEVVLVDGQQAPIRTELVQITGGGTASTANKTAAVGATTGIGAVIGAAAGGGEGAAIGAAAGAAAGVAGVVSARGRPAEIAPETILTFRLEQEVVISTDRSQHAFLPVTPDDYGRRALRASDRYPSAGVYPPPPLYYGPYEYDWYPYPYGYYGYYYGPGYYYYPGFRVYLGRRGRR